MTRNGKLRHEYRNDTYLNDDLQIDRVTFPKSLTKDKEQDRSRRKQQAHKRKRADTPTVSQLLEQHRRKDRDDTPHDTAEYSTSSNRTSRVLLKAVDEVVLRAVQDHDLSDTVEEGCGDGCKPVRMLLYCPREPKERHGDENGANVCQWEAELGSRLLVVLSCERLIHGVDAWDEKPDCEEEPRSRTEIQQSDLLSGETVIVLVDGLHVRVDAVCCAEDERLVYSHDRDDGLRKDLRRALESLREFLVQRPCIFALVRVLRAVPLVALRLKFCLLRIQDNRSIRLPEEKVSSQSVDEAHDGHDPEDPAPVQSLYDDTAKQRSQGRSKQRSQ